MWVDTQETVISEGNLAVLRQMRHKYALGPSDPFLGVYEQIAQVCSGDIFRETHLDNVHDDEECRCDIGQHRCLSLGQWISKMKFYATVRQPTIGPIAT